MNNSTADRRVVYAETNSYEVTNSEIGRGYRGRVLPVVGNPDVAVKVYSARLDEQVRKRTIAKVRRMLGDDLSTLRSARPLFAWPLSLVYRDKQRSRPVGFAMTRLREYVPRRGGYVPLASVVNPPLPEIFPGAGTLVQVAIDIARIISRAHHAGYTVPDMKPENFMIYLPSTPDDQEVFVTMVDCDSLQFEDGEHVYAGEEHNEDFAAPEVLRGEPFSQMADRFALAELVLSVLMLGEHPFSGVPKAARSRDLDQAARVREGLTPLLNRSTPRTNSLMGVLPAEVKDLARQCFGDGHQRPDRRPDADDWIRELLTVRLQRCTANPRHRYARSTGRCEWCRYVSAGGEEPFPVGDTQTTRQHPPPPFRPPPPPPPPPRHSRVPIILRTVLVVAVIAALVIAGVTLFRPTASSEVAAAAGVDAAGEQFVFWRGTDGGLWETWYSAGRWRGPTRIHKAGAIASAPGLAVHARGEQYVFWRGQDGKLWEAWYSARWNGPRKLAVGTIASAPAAGVDAAGEQFVFWRGTDGGLWETWYSAGRWRGPTRIHKAGAIASAPGLAVHARGEQYVFWRGQDGKLWEAWYSARWNGPRKLAVGTIASAPAAGVDAAGEQFVFWRGTDGGLWETWYSAGRWRGPTRIHKAGAIASAPGLAVHARGEQYVFWRGQDGKLWEAWYSGRWNGPIKLT